MQPTKIVVEISGLELGGPNLSVVQIQDAALAFARENLQGCCVTNDATGWQIHFGRRGLNKTLSHAAKREHVQSVVALSPLLERADWICAEVNRNEIEIRNIPLVHTFYALLKIGNSLFAVRMIVKQTNTGQRFYDHDLSELIDEEM